MAAVPIVILIVFLTVRAGGPAAFLLGINDVLQTFANWLVNALS